MIKPGDLKTLANLGIELGFYDVTLPEWSDKTRELRLALEKAKEEGNDDECTSIDWKDENNERNALMALHQRIEGDRVGNIPGHKTENNYNKRSALGKKALKELSK